MSDAGLPRYALPVDRKVLLDDDGFLLPQSDTRWFADGLTAPVTVDNLPQAGTSFALLAAAGAGKTTVFQELHSHETNAKIIAVGSLTRENLERRLASASAEQHPIYLDGLDQAVLHDSRLLHWLEDELTTDTARLVAWRLACRPAAWEASLANVLRRGSAAPIGDSGSHAA